MTIRRLVAAIAASVLLASLIVGGVPITATASPVATSDAQYDLFGAVFPDPHGCLPRVAPWSPYAKGKVCAADFLQFNEMVTGLTFLQSKFPGFIQLARVDEMLGRPNDPAHMSAGLATPDLGHTPLPLWIARVTDESIPDTNKKHYVFPLSIHGIERAGVEGGTRAIEDLATWGATEPAHPLLEASPDASVSAGEALKKTAAYFVFANPDGWRRGDRDGGLGFMRYNGNGVDLNRDWPAIGYTYEPYTPWSEPETRSLGQALKNIREKWDGGIDLHGQLIDRAFSFTLLGQGQNDFGKNQALLDIVQGAWADAENRLKWSPLIKPNTAPADDQRLYGVQWGTVWDTIAYTVTGAFGDWINQPLGLDAVGIDNEMSLSHLSNCGTGTCWIPDVEQLHVDGNKSLIYSMLNFGLRPEDNKFRFQGKAAYLAGMPHLVSAPHLRALNSPLGGLKAQANVLLDLTPANSWTQEFEIKGPSAQVYNGGFRVDTRTVNVGNVSPSSVATLVVERRKKDGSWEPVSSYWNQASTYLQSGQTLAVNDPEPGTWRLRVQGEPAGIIYRSEIFFRSDSGWANPGQLPYDASNEQFFIDLNRFAQTPLAPVLADQIIGGTTKLDLYDTLVIADQMLPGFAEPIPTGPAQAGIVFEGADVAKPAAPCAAVETDTPCASTYEWDVDGAKNNLLMKVSLAWEAGLDYDLYVDRQVDGQWVQVAQSAGSANPEVTSVSRPVGGHYRARAANFAAGPFPSRLAIEFSNKAPASKPGTRTTAEMDAFTAKLRSFVTRGGNLVLTDGAVRLLASMKIIDRPAIREVDQYAGYISFSLDGTAATYDDVLAQNVQRPGAAEGPGHRHQTFDPGPIGFSFDDNAAPNWTVDQQAWEKAGGRSVGVTTVKQVSLGEMPLGKGRIRFIGALIPTPTDRFFHPYGLADYAVTYAGYQLFQNAVGYKAPARTAVKGVITTRPVLPSTGVGGPALGGLLLILGAIALRRWRGTAA
jgi:zinc carboxypeptidase